MTEVPDHVYVFYAYRLYFADKDISHDPVILSQDRNYTCIFSVCLIYLTSKYGKQLEKYVYHNKWRLHSSAGTKFLIANFWFSVFSSFFLARQPPQWAKASSFTRFLDHTQRRTTVGRTPLDEWSAHRIDLYLTTHNNHKHPCPRWNSYPQSQQASGRRPTP